MPVDFFPTITLKSLVSHAEQLFTVKARVLSMKLGFEGSFSEKMVQPRKDRTNFMQIREKIGEKTSKIEILRGLEITLKTT